MSFSGFPDKIDVVIGAGWNESRIYFVEDETITLEKYTDTGTILVYSENGTSVAHYADNRLQLQLQYNGTKKMIWMALYFDGIPGLDFFSSYAYVYVSSLGGGIDAGATYTFKELWLDTAISAFAQYDVLTGDFPFKVPYNPDLFKSMQEWSPPGPSTTPINLGNLIVKGAILS